MRPFAHPDVAAVPLAAVLHALSDPDRLALVRNLDSAAEGLSCTDSCGAVRLPKSTLANHYRVLREAGLVRSRPDGKQVINTLRRTEIEARFPGLLEAVLRAAVPG
ncbi:ArsR/SmtB family transcription factor [Roseomonas sp. CCTCC AB2023176]|uniref:ArsR/SmtB family transcription factor n=1 Tax=Roseomonas sp. CCTCC AB2023176 TaxID=3342640 RepID=UPI0035D55C8F